MFDETYHRQPSLRQALFPVGYIAGVALMAGMSLLIGVGIGAKFKVAEELQMSPKGQHVVPSGNGWAVRSSGAARARKLFGTQKEAIETAREIARSQGGELYIHGRDGLIRERSSYGKDLSPSKG